MCQRVYILCLVCPLYSKEDTKEKQHCLRFRDLCPAVENTQVYVQYTQTRGTTEQRERSRHGSGGGATSYLFI